MIVIEAKSKLEDENKANAFFMYGEQVYMVKSNKKRKQEAYFIMVV